MPPFWGLFSQSVLFTHRRYTLIERDIKKMNSTRKTNPKFTTPFLHLPFIKFTIVADTIPKKERRTKGMTARKRFALGRYLAHKKKEPTQETINAPKGSNVLSL